jgi:hypothetical protein
LRQLQEFVRPELRTGRTVRHFAGIGPRRRVVADPAAADRRQRVVADVEHDVFGAADRADREIARADVHRRRRHLPQQRREIAALAIGDVIGLGRRERHARDHWRRPAQPSERNRRLPPVPLPPQRRRGLAQRFAQIAECVGAGVQRRQQIDQDHHAVELAEQRVGQLALRRGFVRLEATRQQIVQSAAPAHRKERDPGRLGAGRRHQEPTRLQQCEPGVAQTLQQRPVETVAGRRDRLVGRRGGWQRGREGQEFRRLRPPLQSSQRRLGPMRKILSQQRQIEQPLARVVEEFQPHGEWRQSACQTGTRQHHVEREQ